MIRCGYILLCLICTSHSSAIPRNLTGHENPENEVNRTTTLSPANQSTPTVTTEKNLTGHENPENEVNSTTTLSPANQSTPTVTSEKNLTGHENPENDVNSTTTSSPANQSSPTVTTEESRFTQIWLKKLTTEMPTPPGSTPTQYSSATDDAPGLEQFKLKYREYVEPGRNVSALLETVLAKYDKRIRPFYGVKPLNVGIDILILSFGELEEASMEYTVDMYLGQFWQDPRLAFGLDRYIILGGEASEKLWVPDTFFVNSVESKIQTLMFVNKKIWISLNNGTMMLSARLVSRNSCKFDLRNYPLDEQTCHLAFESFSYSEKDLLYRWRNQSIGSDIHVYDREMAQFDIKTAKRYLKHKVYHSDYFSGLTATIVFKRRAAYYIFQMYIPCVCITALSWVSFWINHEAVPARVALSITTVLTISYMRGSVNANMPRVSYLKSIDYFLLVSFVFIFLTLVEYVLVLTYARKQKLRKSKEVNANDDPSEDEMEKKPMQVTVCMGNKSFNFSSSCVDNVENGDGIVLKERHHKMPLLSFRRTKQNGCANSGREQLYIVSKDQKPKNDQIEGHCLDNYSRFLFPLVYVVFLVVYFVYYTNAYNGKP